MPDWNWKERSAFAKALVVFGIGAGIGLGLCGVGAAGNFDSLNIIAAALFVLSVLGLLITGLVWMLVEIFEAIRK
jgi:hypothetical protein